MAQISPAPDFTAAVAAEKTERTEKIYNNTEGVLSSMDNTVYTVQTGPDLTIFLPAYAVLLIKSVDSLKLKDGSCNIKATFVLRVLLGELDDYKFIVKHIKDRISFRINEQPYHMKPDDENVEFKEMKVPCRHLCWTYRMEFDLSFVTDLRSSPFDKLIIPIKLELTSRTVKEEDEEKKDKDDNKWKDMQEVLKKEKKQVRYRFNFHKYTKHAEKEKGQLNLKFKEGTAIAKIPEFNLLYSEMKVDIKVEEKKDPLKNNVDKILIQYAPVIEFKLAFYRNPFATLLNCLGPLIVMMVVPLAIYFQENDLAEKLASLITLLLAIIAYFPTLRAGLPSMPYLTITDVTACLCLLEVIIGGIEALCLANLEAHIFSRICLAFLLLLPLATVVFLFWKIGVYYYRKREYDIKPESKNVPSSIFEPFEWEGWRPKGKDKARPTVPGITDLKESTQINGQKTEDPEKKEHKIELEPSPGNVKQKLISAPSTPSGRKPKLSVSTPRKQSILDLIAPKIIYKYQPKRSGEDTPCSPDQHGHDSVHALKTSQFKTK